MRDSVALPRTGGGISLALMDLDVTYGGAAVLSGFSLSVQPGEFFGLIGPSGCGKSTTLGVIAGFVMPRSGAVHLDGRDVVGLPPQRRRIGMVFQSYALFPHMTVAENVAYGLPRGRPADRAARIAELLALVRLPGKHDRTPKQLSGGEQQRVAIARALAIDPQLLLLDEPLSNLDARLRGEMQAELHRIQRATQVTTIFVTHDQEEAQAICDRIAIMNQGRIEQIGTARDIYRAPRTRFVAEFVGRSSRLATVAGPDGTLRLNEISLRCVAATEPGRHYMLYLRPEELGLAHTRTDDNALPGRIRSVIEAGPTRYYAVETAAGMLEAARPSREPDAFGMDAVVHVTWPRAAGTVLPE